MALKRVPQRQLVQAERLEDRQHVMRTKKVLASPLYAVSRAASLGVYQNILSTFRQFETRLQTQDARHKAPEAISGRDMSRACEVWLKN